MSSEWLKVMLDEVARKKAESVAAQAEEARREKEALLNDAAGVDPSQPA